MPTARFSIMSIRPIPYAPARSLRTPTSSASGAPRRRSRRAGPPRSRHDVGRSGGCRRFDREEERLLGRRGPGSSRMPASIARPNRLSSTEYGDSGFASTGMPRSSGVRDLRVARPDRSRSGAITLTPGYVRLEGELEAQLVVALAGAAVDDRVGAELERDLGDRLGDHRPRERGDERVLPLVERVREQRLGDLLVGERLACGRAAGRRPRLRPCRARSRGSKSPPARRRRARRRPRRSRSPPSATRSRSSCRARPSRRGRRCCSCWLSPSRWWRSSSASCAARGPSRAATKIVSSPATVPATSGRPRSSIARASAFAWPGGVWITTTFPVGVDRERPAAQRERELAQPVEVGGAGQRVHEPAFRVAHLHEPELGDVARDGRLDGVVAGLAQRVGELALRRRSGCSLDEPQDRALRGRTCSCEHLLEDRERVLELVAVTVSGGVRRRTLAPAVPTSRPRSRHAATTRRPAGRARRRAGARGRAPRRRRAALRARRRGTRRSAATCCEQLVVSSSQTAHAAAHATGLPPNVRGVVAGRESAGASSATSRQPIGRPLASPFASVSASRPDAECSQAKNVPVRPTPVCTSSKSEQRAVLVGERARRRQERRRQRVDAALALDRLEQDAAGLGRRRPPPATRRRSGRANATPGTSGSNASRFAGLARHGERAERPAVERVLERDDARLAGRLARVLQAASIASAPELQKNALRAAEARRTAAARAPPSARSSRGSRRARAGRAGRARRRAAPGGSGRGRRLRSRPGSPGSAAVGVEEPVPSPRTNVRSCAGVDG